MKVSILTTLCFFVSFSLSAMQLAHKTQHNDEIEQQQKPRLNNITKQELQEFKETWRRESQERYIFKNYLKKSTYLFLAAIASAIVFANYPDNTIIGLGGCSLFFALVYGWRASVHFNNLDIVDSADIRDLVMHYE